MDDVTRFIEEIGLYYEGLGMQRTAGRIIGYLLICDPPAQTIPDLVEALKASKSTISVALWQLQTFRLVERFGVPGERRDYFRLGTDVWERSLQARLDEMNAFKEIAMRGLALPGIAEASEGSPVRQRLEQMDEFFSFFDREFPKLLAQWQVEKKRLHPQKKG